MQVIARPSELVERRAARHLLPPRGPRSAYVIICGAFRGNSMGAFNRAVIGVALAAMLAVPTTASARALSCHDRQGYYVNSDGQLVLRPKCTNRRENGETAICADGSHSFSRHHQGTCSHHGGVARWE